MSRIQMHYVEQSRLAAFVDVTAQTKKMDIHEPLVLRGKFFLFLIQPCLTHPNGLGDIIPDTPLFDIRRRHMILILFRERVSGHLQTRSDTRRQAVLRYRRIAFPVRQQEITVFILSFLEKNQRIDAEVVGEHRAAQGAKRLVVLIELAYRQIAFDEIIQRAVG